MNRKIRLFSIVDNQFLNTKMNSITNGIIVSHKCYGRDDGIEYARSKFLMYIYIRNLLLVGPL